MGAAARVSGTAGAGRAPERIVGHAGRGPAVGARMARTRHDPDSSGCGSGTAGPCQITKGGSRRRVANTVLSASAASRGTSSSSATITLTPSRRACALKVGAPSVSSGAPNSESPSSRSTSLVIGPGPASPRYTRAAIGEGCVNVPLTIARPAASGVSAVTWVCGRHHSVPKASGTPERTNSTRPSGAARSAAHSAGSRRPRSVAAKAGHPPGRGHSESVSRPARDSATAASTTARATTPTGTRRPAASRGSADRRRRRRPARAPARTRPAPGRRAATPARRLQHDGVQRDHRGHRPRQAHEDTPKGVSGRRAAATPRRPGRPRAGGRRASARGPPA